MSREASSELLRHGLNFYGNVEATNLQGTNDIVVCDGFVGNVALKSTDGLVRMLKIYLQEEVIVMPN